MPATFCGWTGTELGTAELACPPLARLLAAAVEGVGGAHRGAVAVQQEALKAVERLLKEKELGEPVK